MSRTLFITILITLCLSSCNTTTDEEQIKTVYKGYAQAIANKQGMEATKYLDSYTIEFFGRLLDCIKYCDSVALASEEFYPKFATLLARNLMHKDKIHSIQNGEQLYATFVNLGLVDNDNEMMSLNISHLNIDTDLAIATMVDSNADTSYAKLYFIKQDDEWKFGMIYLLKSISEFLESEYKAKGVSDIDFINAAILMGTGHTMSKNSWQSLSDHPDNSMEKSLINSPINIPDKDTAAAE